jgi:hypothetical protein
VDFKAKEHPDPASVVHPDCRLQKDNGKGEPLGRAISISAEGRRALLESYDNYYLGLVKYRDL